MCPCCRRDFLIDPYDLAMGTAAVATTANENDGDPNGAPNPGVDGAETRNRDNDGSNRPGSSLAGESDDDVELGCVEGHTSGESHGDLPS